MKPQRVDYCQFILGTQINYTQTYFADHHRYYSHDAINRYFSEDKITPSAAWRAVKYLINPLGKSPGFAGETAVV